MQLILADDVDDDDDQDGNVTGTAALKYVFH